MRHIYLYIIFLPVALFFINCDSNNTDFICNETVVLQSYEQDAYELILDYESSASVAEASITSGNANPNDGIILPVTDNKVDFSQAGLTAGNYGLYLRTLCTDGNNGAWSHITPIIINNLCEATVTLNSFEQNGTLFEFDVDISPNNYGTTLQMRLINTAGEAKVIEQLSNYNSLSLIEKNIAPETYILSMRTVCEDGRKGEWTQPVEINIDDYHCLKPYHIQGTVSVGGNAYVWWWDGNYDYSQWQYVIVLQGEPLTNGTIVTTDLPHPPIFANYPPKDVYARGVCSENTYTDWVQVW